MCDICVRIQIEVLKERDHLIEGLGSLDIRSICTQYALLAVLSAFGTHGDLKRRNSKVT